MPIQLAQLNDWLQLASFTYARCIPMLPSPLREACTLAYLLLRNGDSLEDAFSLSKQERLEGLGKFREVISHPDDQELAKAFAARYEHKDCLENSHHLEVLRQTPFIMKQLLELRAEHPDYVEVIIRHVKWMLEGMQYWVSRYDEKDHLSLQSLKELEDYCYPVACIPGQMLTNLFSAYSPYISKDLLLHLLTLGNNYAIGVQIANILKNFSQDKKEGRVYIPKEFLPSGPDEDLDKIIPILVHTYQNLTLGIEYEQNLPVAEVSIRSFCLVPLLLAATVLNQLLRRPEELFSDDGIKVPLKGVSSLLEQVNTVVATNQSIWKFWEQLTPGLKVASQQFTSKVCETQNP